MGALNDLTGQVFGRLTVTERALGPVTVWWCSCSCGGETVVRAAHLVSGAITSCGCARRESRGVRDLTGQTFGLLTVVERVENLGDRVAWRCRCSCGTETTVRANNLTSGNTRSCGCSRSRSGNSS